MIKEGKFGSQEAIFLVVIALSNRIFFDAPGVVVRVVGTAGWYMALISNATSLLFFTFIYLLLKRFPGKGILEIFTITLGPVIGFGISFIYAASFLIAGGVLLREFAEVFKIYVFPNTPISVLAGSMIVVIVLSAFLGLETIARTAKLAGYFLLGGHVLILIFSMKQYKIANLYPVLGYGLGKTILEGVTRSSAYAEIIIIAIFAGSLQGSRQIKKIGYLSLILSGIIVSSAIFCMELAFPYYSFQELVSPMYAMVRNINLGIFIQRLDPLFLFGWVFTTIISSSTLFYSAISCYCKLYRLQDKRPIILPMAVLLFSMTLIPDDFISVVEDYIELLRVFPILTYYIIPLITLGIAILRKKKGDKEANASC